MPPSTIRNLQYAPTSYLDQKHQFVGFDSLKHYNTHNDDMSASCNTEEKEQLDALEDKLLEKSRQEDRLSQVYHSLGTLKRKQAYRSMLKGETIASQESLLPPNVMFHGLDPKYYDENDPSCPLSKDNFRHHENGEYKFNEEDEDAVDFGEQYKIRMLRSQRLKQLTLKTQEEILFLESREEKRQQALEQAKWDALHEEQERLTIAQQREQLDRERAAFEIMRQATLKKAIDQRRKDRNNAKKEVEEKSRSSIDGCRGFNIFNEADDMSAMDGSVFPSPIQDLFDSMAEACDRLIFCGGVMDPTNVNGKEVKTPKKNAKRSATMVPPEVMLSESDTFADTLTAPDMDEDNTTIEEIHRVDCDKETKSKALA
ncbi:unnamed protein product [Cylindrotheca closterium]|uniref:Uncharacterized protein n=1 Tax=Cylindrotheca closterium TaxID=2856 RepID=A0AAD2FZJ6_9STRA|nr:unnamed protein product [Cylindrotheca closterium]